MAGAAAAVLRSVARRSKKLQACARSLPVSHPLPQANPAAVVLSRRLLFHVGLIRRQELPLRATSTRLFSGSAKSSNKDPVPPCTGSPMDVVDHANLQQAIASRNKELLEPFHNKQVMDELRRQIEEKKEELTHLLQQMDVEKACAIQQEGTMTCAENTKDNGKMLQSAKEVPVELKKQIVEKKEELLHLLLQMDTKLSFSYLKSDKHSDDEKEQLLQLLRDFQRNTQRTSTPRVDGFARFLTKSSLALTSVLIVTLLATKP